MWQENSHIIVMTTNQVERGRVRPTLSLCPSVSLVLGLSLCRTSAPSTGLMRRIPRYIYYTGLYATLTHVCTGIWWSVPCGRCERDFQPALHSARILTPPFRGGSVYTLSLHFNPIPSIPAQEGNARHVYQFHFKAWPDHGVPHEPGVALGFLHVCSISQCMWWLPRAILLRMLA